VNYIHTTLSKTLKDAVGDGLIPRNVTEGVKAPRPKKKEVNPLTAEQARCLLEAAYGERFEALYIVALTAGLREGELLGLKWEDVDLGGGKLSVRRTLSETKERGHIFEPPKVLQMPLTFIGPLRLVEVAANGVYLIHYDIKGLSSKTCTKPFSKSPKVSGTFPSLLRATATTRG
jgi:integrase